MKYTESYLLLKKAAKLKSDVITVPHHGSKTSSTKSFLEATSPTLALIPVGYRNSFGHPKEKILKRYQKLEIPIMDTVNKGAIIISFPKNKEKYQASSYRVQNRKFWNR